MTGWRFRVLRRYGLCEQAAWLAAESRTIELPDFAELVARGCPPQLALRILAPLDRLTPGCEGEGC